MIHEDVRDRVAWLTFDRPERLNAFTGADYVSLREHVERIAGDASVRVVVLTGTGRAFSAGADRSLVDGTAAEADRELAAIEFPAVLGALEACSKPILAAVNGLAVGFGATVLLYCDLVLMAESARLRLPFTSLGIVPEAGSSALMAARARWSDVVWSMLSSEWIDAPSAHAMGLAWRVLADGELLDATQQAATTIAAHEPAAVAATKRLLTAGRADVARAAIEREYAAMRALAER